MGGGGEARVGALYRDVERISLKTRVPLQAVIAILENLRERSEHPVEDRESRI
jgi:hypothetical protein